MARADALRAKGLNYCVSPQRFQGSLRVSLKRLMFSQFRPPQERPSQSMSWRQTLKALPTPQHAALRVRNVSSLSAIATSTGPHPSLTPKVPDFSDSALAFSNASTMELFRGAAVLTACAQPWLVLGCESLLKLSKTILGERTTQAVLRHTVFAHFVAGECESTIKPRLEQLHALRVGGILDYAVEAKLVASTSTNRIHPCSGEDTYDANMRTFMKAVRTVHTTMPHGFAAIKVSALGDPALLERVSSTILALRAFYDSLGGSYGRLTQQLFVDGWTAAFDVSRHEAIKVFARFDRETADGSLDALEFTNSLPLEEIPSLVRSCRSKGPLYLSALSTDEVRAFGNMMRRLETISSLAWQLDVRLMVDAEHTYFQPCIDQAVLRLQRSYNAHYPAVFGTYQAYLVDCSARLEVDLERARREGVQCRVRSQDLPTV